MKTYIICVGISTLDKVWPVAELPVSGGKYRSTDYFELGGGMAANAAVAVSRLGGVASYWGRAGDDPAGHAMKNEMAAYGVDVENFRLHQDAKSSISAVIVSHDGERVIVNYPGTGLLADASWLPLQQVQSASAVHADVRWVEGTTAVYSMARSHGIPTVLDGETANRNAFSKILPLTDHAIFSEPGLRSFIGDPSLDRTSYPAVLEKVRALGCRVAAVTRGADGILWHDETGMHEQAAFAVDVVDTTGAGDVFHGAYALALGERQDVASAMRFSSAVSALKCTRPGGRAGIPTREEVEAFLAEHG
ncbi:MAG TPA: sugar kinase [Burkholderiaceae bacterium]|jgi:sulfofructose kinase|nr:sugar kinase [Burkholderiaceae bacterium]